MIAIGVVASWALSLSSCKNCTTCRYTYEFLGTETTYTYPETCGKKSEIEAYTRECEDVAQSVNGNCVCD